MSPHGGEVLLQLRNNVSHNVYRFHNNNDNNHTNNIPTNEMQASNNVNTMPRMIMFNNCYYPYCVSVVVGVMSAIMRDLHLNNDEYVIHFL